MKKILRLVLALGLMVLVGLVGLAQTTVTPRSVGVLLFDNETGADVSGLMIIFDKPVTLGASDVLAIGGGEVTDVVVLARGSMICEVRIQVAVVAGGTLQIMLPNDCADAQVIAAFWRL